jgi:RNA polymerase sigma-70 factor (ECF subfamily)
MTEAQLLRRAREGDEDAFSQLFARHERAVFRYAAYMSGHDDADDIVQETFLVVLQQTSRRDAPTGTVRAYLMGIARHRVLKRLASRGARIEAESIDCDDSPEIDTADVTALDFLVDTERLAAVRAAVHALPPVFREALVLCDLQELPYADAAAVLECPVGTVRSRLSRGRSLLAAALSAYRPRTRTGGTTA